MNENRKWGYIDLGTKYKKTIRRGPDKQIYPTLNRALLRQLAT